MEIQVDIINRLVQHPMILIARDIFFLLDFRSLRNCELVSKSWYFAIRNDNIWKRRYHREEMKRPHFYQCLEKHAIFNLHMEHVSLLGCLYNKLLLAIESDQRKLKLPWNLFRNTNYHEVMFLTMDDKWIIVGRNDRYCEQYLGFHLYPAVVLVEHWSSNYWWLQINTSLTISKRNVPSTWLSTASVPWIVWT